MPSSSVVRPALPTLEGDDVAPRLWQSEAGLPVPGRVCHARADLCADQAYRAIAEGQSFLWQDDYHQARQLLQALNRRIERSWARRPATAQGATAAEQFHRHRRDQAQRARQLSALLIPVDPGGRIPLRRAPDVRAALQHALPAALLDCHFALPLRELQGMIGAYEWYRKGVPIAALGASIHPHYGVFSPVRGEYVDLVAQAPLPGMQEAIEIGVGSGVLSAVLAQRGIQRILATDCAPRALSCARENLERLGLADRVELRASADFPQQRTALLLCNPPWLPVKPHTPIEHALYDPDHALLRSVLTAAPTHLIPGGELWVILSDLAEHLGLRPPGQLERWIEEAGLRLLERHTTRPRHPKASNPHDPLCAARSRETTFLLRLGVR